VYAGFIYFSLAVLKAEKNTMTSPTLRKASLHICMSSRMCTSSPPQCLHFPLVPVLLGAQLQQSLCSDRLFLILSPVPTVVLPMQ